jgi:hypothetical protein
MLRLLSITILFMQEIYIFRLLLILRNFNGLNAKDRRLRLDCRYIGGESQTIECDNRLSGSANSYAESLETKPHDQILFDQTKR